MNIFKVSGAWIESMPTYDLMDLFSLKGKCRALIWLHVMYDALTICPQG